MSGAISAVSVAGATAAAGSTGLAATAAAAGGALAANAGIIGLASTALGGLGAIQSSRAASASAGYNAKVAAQNAQVAMQNAQFAGAEGQQNAAASNAKTRAAIGATEASQGASGVDIGSGSFANVRESEDKLGATNTANIRAEAARQAYGFQSQASSFTGQAALDKAQQQSDKIGGYLDSGAKVLGGVASASKFNNWMNSSSSSFGPWDSNANGND